MAQFPTEPTRPIGRPGGVENSDNLDMVTQQRIATQRFEKNTSQLQAQEQSRQAAEQTANLSPQQAHAPDRQALKLEHANPAGAEEGPPPDRSPRAVMRSLPVASKPYTRW